tara:strand:+ start:22 stop:1971 length:1950 start_codon:yes stop_codon:yes gene_type:complete
MNKVLWTPSNKKSDASKMTQFINFINHKYNTSIDDYLKLHDWSINNISLFWDSISVFFKIKFSTLSDSVFKPGKRIYESKWFNGARLNYAENLLDTEDTDKIAIEFFNELGDKKTITYGRLSKDVSLISNLFQNNGLKKGDRVAAMMPNIPETIISSLACASLGGVWSSCSPDFGEKAILDRFEQIKPKILIACNGYTFKGKKYSTASRIDVLVSKLKSVKCVILVDYINDNSVLSSNYIHWKDIDFSCSTESNYFEQMKFNDPLYVMFSSGTTGKPKSIVHSIGGTLIQHVKELGLHTDLKSDEKIMYYTTCGWMMWNWVLSSLYFNSTLVLYEGSPFYPNKDSMLEIIDKNNINIFGTSAKYISYIQTEKLSLINKFKFKNLKTILSTGSALTEDNFQYIVENIKKNVQISSISGGTDIISCFALGNPIVNVVSGELQCLGLGMDVASFDSNGIPVKNKKGELVCRKPFPSMPIYFLNDSNGEKYFKSYFAKYENIWTHGDFIEINDNGGAVIYGRSDATLNPGGIRIGTSEIYSAIESLDFLEDSIAVNLVKSDSYILFVKLVNSLSLDDDIVSKIKNSIKINLSPKHVPASIFSVADIPYTINGKKVEIAVKNIVNGEEVENIDSISNSECLNEFLTIIKKNRLT